MRPYYEIPWQLLQTGQTEALKNFLIQPAAMGSMMNSYSLDPVKGLIVGNLVHDLSNYWVALQKIGYEPRAELRKCVQLKSSTVKRSIKANIDNSSPDLVDISQLAADLLTVQVNRLLTYLGEEGLGSDANFPSIKGHDSSPIDEAMRPMEELEDLFELKRQQVVLMHRIKSDIKSLGRTASERANRLITLSNGLRGSVEVAKQFITEFEPGARNFDQEFGFSYLGALNWWPLAHAYYLVDEPDRAVAIFQDVSERLANAPGQEFLAQQIKVNVQCAGAMRSLQSYCRACERLLDVIDLMDGGGGAWKERIPQLLDDTFNIATEAEIDASQLAILQRLVSYRSKYFHSGNGLQETIQLLLLITHHPYQDNSVCGPALQELLLETCRLGLSLYMRAKHFDETREWARLCLPAYEKVFGVQGERSIALRRITEQS